MSVRLDHAICSSLADALQREWLETNGLGGYASSTVAGAHTRRYHGLLMAATQPPAGRVLLLSKLEETLVIGGHRFELSANNYPGAVHPRGFEYLQGFRLDPFPVFTFRAGGVELEKRVFMVHGENTTVVEYELRGLVPSDCRIELRPLIAFRDFHATTHRNDALDPAFVRGPGIVSVAPYPGLPRLYLAHNAELIEDSGVWYENFEFDRERERGLDYREDLFNPFIATFPLPAGGRAVVIASTQVHDVSDAPRLRQMEIQRRAAVRTAVPTADPLVKTLVAAADQFLVERGNLQSIIAGYHWFADWGRDTMIALPGLTLVTGRAKVAKNILLAFARSADQGMLPNRFPDAGETPEYNTVDASLWFFEAVRALLKHTGDSVFVRENLYETLREILAWHLRGTRYGIRVDDDCLLLSGEPGVQLTWMDAKTDGHVVTPRQGKPVEIQALWYNAVRVMQELAREFGDTQMHGLCMELSARARDSFNRLFWNEAAGCLFDVIDGGARDPSIRPNQVFAVSLPYSMLPAEKARRVLNVVERELITPYGLRTLSPRDRRYLGRYEGGPRSRDSAYHQGTVWPWLLGPFITAYLTVHGRTPSAQRQAARWIEPFRSHVNSAGLGQISEIFDGDPPHQARGCIAQAWSVAELLRVLVEEIKSIPLEGV
ncbi:MAG: glycogen debranching enzyme family protein [Candidatus Solibacter usitatus]|nr:glycogen debranching enzyme family protein [Candidatus Solibacter usitatus]